MEYTPFILGVCGILGILFHNLIELGKINKAKKGKASLQRYIAIEIYNILASLIVVIVAVIIEEEITNSDLLESLGVGVVGMGLSFFAIGYMGQSVIISKFGKADKIDEDK